MSGLLLSLGFGSYLVWSVRQPPVACCNVLAALALFGSFGFHLFRRIRWVTSPPPAWLDLGLFTHVTVLAYALILESPGGLAGPMQPVIYAVVMAAAAFARPLAAVGTAGFAVLLETCLATSDLGSSDLAGLGTHALLTGTFALLNWVLLRVHLARVRRLSRGWIESEKERMKEAARGYRLLVAPSSATTIPCEPLPKNDEERLVQSGVEEIHEALRLALNLLRRSLKLNTAALLWLDASTEQLHLREISTLEQDILPGPYPCRDGIWGAALARGQPVSLVGTRAARHLPFYAKPPSVGAVCALPVLQHGRPRGVLMVDRQARIAFSREEDDLLLAATHFALRAIENERVFIQLEHAKLEQGKLYRASNLLAAATLESQVLEVAVSGAREFAAFDFALVTLFEQDKLEHEIRAASGNLTKCLVGQRFAHNSGLVSMAVANRHTLPYRGDYDPACQMVLAPGLVPPPVASLLVVPLRVHECALGTLIFGSRRRGALGETVRPTLEVLASHIAVSLSNARLLRRLEALATTDGLTGLLNKRALLEAAEQKLRSAARFNKPLALLVCDLDHFKQVNDRYGHDVGDRVIRGLADVLRRVKRDIDVVGRFGGEEFVVVCEETDAEGAGLLAERIRVELAATSFQTSSGPLWVTCSVGVAPYPKAGRDWDALFHATDEALYASKRGGRNRVTLWSPKLQGHAA